MRKIYGLLSVLLIGFMLAALAGCSKVTQENYGKIESGMTLSDVEAILGKGKEEAGIGGAIGDLAASGKVLTWGDEQKSITVTFANDKVVTKSQKGL